MFYSNKWPKVECTFTSCSGTPCLRKMTIQKCRVCFCTESLGWFFVLVRLFCFNLLFLLPTVDGMGIQSSSRKFQFALSHDIGKVWVEDSNTHHVSCHWKHYWKIWQRQFYHLLCYWKMGDCMGNCWELVTFLQCIQPFEDELFRSIVDMQYDMLVSFLQSILFKFLYLITMFYTRRIFKIIMVKGKLPIWKCIYMPIYM